MRKEKLIWLRLSDVSDNEAVGKEISVATTR